MRTFFSAFEDNAGGVSSYRVLLFLSFGIVGVIWVKAGWMTNTLPEIPASVRDILVAMLAGKVVQRFGEK